MFFGFLRDLEAAEDVRGFGLRRIVEDTRIELECGECGEPCH